MTPGRLARRPQIRYCLQMYKVSLLGLALFVIGCDDPKGGGQDMAVNVVIPHNFEQINTEILQPSCAAFSVCHSTAGNKDAGHLNLEVDPYKAQLVEDLGMHD